MRIISIYAQLINPKKSSVDDTLFAHSINPMDLGVFVHEVCFNDYGVDFGEFDIVRDINSCWNSTDPHTLCDKTFNYGTQNDAINLCLRVHCSYL